MVCSVTDKVRQERCLWEGAAYSLAKEVMKEEGTQELRTLRRLQLGEKAWAQQARHFTTLLCQADIRQVYTVSTTILLNTHNYHICTLFPTLFPPMKFVLTEFVLLLFNSWGRWMSV